MIKGKVDIGIACGPSQSHNWWVSIMSNLLIEERQGINIGAIRASGSALPDHNKNMVVDDQRGNVDPPANPNEKLRNDLTDSNRVAITTGFMSGEAEWLFWMDDDTVPPPGALSKLLSLRRDFVAGIYYLAKYPHNVIAYKRDKEWGYAAVQDYPQGALMEVDSVGMGCTLIHRSVYDKIRDGFTVFQRPNGSLIPIKNERVQTSSGSNGHVGYEPVVENNVLHMRLNPLDPDNKTHWPFYALEYGRTEDHYFCELAAAVGIKPYIDTTIVCDHWKLRAINRQAHKLAVQRIKQGGR